MLNVWFLTKKVEIIFGGMKNILYLCIVNQKSLAVILRVG